MIPTPRSLRLAFVAALALLAAVLTAPANASAPVQDIAGRGSVWHAVQVDTDGSRADLTLALREVTVPLQFGVRVWRNGQIVSHTNAGVRAGGERGVLVSAKPMEGVDLTVNNLDRYDDLRLSEVSLQLTLNPPGQEILKGRYTVLVWGASRTIGNWTWTVQGSGIQVVGATRGHTVHFATSRDFDRGTANVLVGHNRGEDSTFARAQVAARYGIKVKKLLIGDFFQDPGAASRLTVSHPDHSEACIRSCAYTATTGPGAQGPGEYGFTIDGAGVGESGGEAGEVVLSAVDVTLPGPV